MQGITRRGHLVLAGLIGVFIGILVVVSWASPVTTSARTMHIEPANTVVNAAFAPDAASQTRLQQDALAAQQRMEAETYPVHIADVSGVRNAETVSSAARSANLHAALLALQQAEAEVYPSRILIPSTNPNKAGDSSIRTMVEMLLNKQRVEADYFPGH